MARGIYKRTKEHYLKVVESRKWYKHTQKTKEKIKEAMNKPEIKNKMRFINLGKKHSNETKLKISKNRKGIIARKSGFKQSQEIKDKISNTLKGNIPWNKGKKGVYTKEWIEGAKERRMSQIFPIKDSLTEIKIQNYLKELKIEFYTHQRMNIDHAYQCDIFIPSMNLVIECDGTYWHSYPTGREIDHIRTKELIEKGFKVLRLWEFEIKEMTLNQFKEKLK